MESTEIAINNNSVCTFRKAKTSPKPIISNETNLKLCLNFLENFQQATERKLVDDFIKEFMLTEIEEISNKNSTTIPVSIFNPTNLISASSSYAQTLKNYFKKSFYQAVILDCAEIEGKTEFFTEIFRGILDDCDTFDSSTFNSMAIPYDFSAFLSVFNTIKPTRNIVLIFNNSSQMNLSHLDDFVRLWERKLKDFIAVPQLKFVFDDSVSFLGMEARLRDRFRVKEFKVPNLIEIFDLLVNEMIERDLPFLFDPYLMHRFTTLVDFESVSFNSIVNQIKFLLISHFNSANSQSSPLPSSFKNVYLLLSNLITKLKDFRSNFPELYPSKHFYHAIFNEILEGTAAFYDIINGLKALEPTQLIKLFSNPVIDEKSQVYEIISKSISAIKKKFSDASAPSTLEALKDFQLDLVASFVVDLKAIKITIPANLVISDPRGNVRKAFEADPQASLQIALKFPSFYLNCKSGCCSTNLNNVSEFKSSNLISQLTPYHHNRPQMLDICLLYRTSLEFNCKSINLVTWYKSFSALIDSSKSLSMARFFKALNELQLIGMVSEFGKSRRKRRSVDRLNVSDSFDFE